MLIEGFEVLDNATKAQLLREAAQKMIEMAQELDPTGGQQPGAETKPKWLILSVDVSFGPSLEVLKALLQKIEEWPLYYALGPLGQLRHPGRSGTTAWMDASQFYNPHYETDPEFYQPPAGFDQRTILVNAPEPNFLVRRGFLNIGPLLPHESADGFLGDEPKGLAAPEGGDL